MGALNFGSTPAISSNKWKSLLRSEDDNCRLSSDECSPSGDNIAEVNIAIHKARQQRAMTKKVNDVYPLITNCLLYSD